MQWHGGTGAKVVDLLWYAFPQLETDTYDAP